MNENRPSSSSSSGGDSSGAGTKVLFKIIRMCFCRRIFLSLSIGIASEVLNVNLMYVWNERCPLMRRSPPLSEAVMIVSNAIIDFVIDNGRISIFESNCVCEVKLGCFVSEEFFFDWWVCLRNVDRKCWEKLCTCINVCWRWSEIIWK